MGRSSNGLPDGDRSPTRSWRRTIATLRVLMEADASATEIIDKVTDEFEENGDSAYSKQGERAVYALRRDLKRLKDDLGCEIRYSRGQGAYQLIKFPFLLSLPSEELQAMAMIGEVFSPSMPCFDGVQALLARLRRYLDQQQLKALERLERKKPISFEDQPSDNVAGYDADITRMQWAIENHQEIAFIYNSPSSGKFLRRRVEPISISVKDGHYYLLAYDRQIKDERRFRLERISLGTVEVLPTIIPPSKRKIQTYTLRFRMTRARARYGVTVRFPDQHHEVLDDAAVMVTATITDTFEAVRTLLRYGDGVECLEPPEVRDELARIATEMSRIYGVEKSK